MYNYSGWAFPAGIGTGSCLKNYTGNRSDAGRSGKETMRIWLVTVGEPLPSDEDKPRLHRTGILADAALRKGHEVVWWSSTFDHAKKVHRFSRAATLNPAPGLTLKLLHSIGYKSNVSLARMYNHYMLGRQFARLAPQEPQPDVILASMPTIELSLESARYGKARNIPVALDMRDMWPDIFVKLAPAPVQPIARAMLHPLFSMLEEAASKAVAITGMSEPFVEWGLGYAGRTATPRDRWFPFAYSEQQPSGPEVEAAFGFWEKHGIKRGDGKFTVCFFGMLGRQFDIETVIEAARKLSSSGPDIRFVLCGSGDNLEKYRRLSADCQNVLLPGWVNKAQVWTLMRLSSAGLAPYRSSPDFEMSYPNKPMEYMSAGLPVVSSLGGILRELLAARDCGITYPKGDPDGLAHTLISLQNNPVRCRQLSANSSKTFEEMFMAEKVYPGMISWLQDISISGTSLT